MSPPVRTTQKSAKSVPAMDAELQALVRRQVIKAVEVNVPAQVSKSVARVVNASSIQNIGK